MTAWQKMLVDPTLFTSTVRQTSRVLRRLICGVLCAQKSWCSLWCFAELTQCQLTDLIVSPSYIPPNTTGALLCYTRIRKDIVVGATVVSSYTGWRNPKVLANGYYTNDIYECSRLFPQSYGAWFQFDLHSVFTVSEVTLKADKDELGSTFFADFEVRVGMSSMSSSGNFSSFTLLGTYVGPGLPNETVVLRSAEPLTGRYVSIQRKTYEKLMICHLEIK